jgi:hypothetical protein
MDKVLINKWTNQITNLRTKQAVKNNHLGTKLDSDLRTKLAVKNNHLGTKLDSNLTTKLAVKNIVGLFDE